MYSRAVKTCTYLPMFTVKWVLFKGVGLLGVRSGSVIQATRTFEDGLRMGVFPGGCLGPKSSHI